MDRSEQLLKLKAGMCRNPGIEVGCHSLFDSIFMRGYNRFAWYIQLFMMVNSKKILYVVWDWSLMFLLMSSCTTGTFAFQEKTVGCGMNHVSRSMDEDHLIIEMICMRNSLKGSALPNGKPSLRNSNS